jgi:hypothetical protein
MDMCGVQNTTNDEGQDDNGDGKEKEVRLQVVIRLCERRFWMASGRQGWR